MRDHHQRPGRPRRLHRIGGLQRHRSPPTVLVCMNRLSVQRETFANNGVLCVNVLAGDQGDVSLAFSQSAREGTAKRFETGLWTEVNHGLPALRGALVSLACRVTNTVEVGSHNVLFSEVDAVIDRQ
ncbi:flavin reductase [Novosphingobium pokkalii]|uniref:flavin reductase n=1 Tax=Novosphingobium pokkalii TaxID=1770194 RepID=UPI00363264B5